MEYTLTKETLTLFNSDGDIFLEMSVEKIIDYITRTELNATGMFEQDYFEERDESGGFTYTPIDVEIKDDPYMCLLESTEFIVTQYLQNLIDND